MEKEAKNGVAGFSAVMTALNCIGLVVSAGFSLGIRENVLEVFEDLDAQVPLLTRALLGVPFLVWIAVPVVLFIALIAKEFLFRKKTALLLNGLFLLGIVIYWGVFTVAVMMPMLHMVQALQAG